jgi:hypothetical protein
LKGGLNAPAAVFIYASQLPLNNGPISS